MAYRLPDKLTVQSVTELLDQQKTKYQQDAAMQKKEMFFWFHAETKGRDDTIEKNKNRIAELEEETARLAAQNATFSSELEASEGKLAAAEARAVAFEAQVESQQREFETARQTLTQQNQEALDAAAARRMQMEEQATEKLNKEIGVWEKRSEEKEATITDLRAQLNAMTESDYRKKQDIIKLREQVQALERDIRQNSEAALRQQSEQLKVNFRVKRQLVESRSTAHRCVQELFQLTEQGRTSMLADENAFHALFVQSDTWRHELSRQAAAGISAVQEEDVSLPKPLLSPHGGAFSNTYAPQDETDQILLNDPPTTAAGLPNRAAMARRAAEHVRQLKNESLEAIEAMQQLKDDIRDVNAERDEDSRISIEARKEVERLQKEHAEQIKLMQQEWEQERTTSDRQRKHEVAMANENLERLKKNLFETEEKMRVQAEHESKLQAEAYAFRSMHQNYFAQIEHYKKAAQQAQSELKVREDEAWKHKIAYEKVVTDLKNQKLAYLQLKSANEGAENKASEANDKRNSAEAAAQQRIATLERSLLASVNEVHNKTRDFKALQRRIEELTSKVEESAHATETLAAAPSHTMFSYPPFAYTQQQLQQTQVGQMAPYFLPPLSPAPPPIPLNAFPSIFDSTPVKQATSPSKGSSPPKARRLATVREEPPKPPSYKQLADDYSNYKAKDGSESERGRRRNSAHNLIPDSSAAKPPPLAPKAFVPVPPPNQGPTEPQPSSGRASKIPAPRGPASSSAPPRKAM